MHFLVWLKGLGPYLRTDKKLAPEKHEILVSSTLLIGTILYSLFAVINYVHGFYSLSLTQVILFLVYLCCFLMPSKKFTMQAKGNIAIAGAIALMWMLYIVGGIEDSGIYWLSILPFIVFTMSGIKTGWNWLMMFVAVICLLQALDMAHIYPVAYSFGETVQFLSAFSIFTVLAFVFEVLRLQSWDELQCNYHQLEQTRGTLNQTLNNLEKDVGNRTFELKESNRRLQQEIEQHKATNYILRETEQKFYQAQKMESLGALVGGLAHDFNSTLTGISANLFFIQREIKGNAVVQGKLDDVEKLVFHASETSKQLLTFARKDKVDKKKFDMAPFINEAMKLGVSALSSRIKVEKEISDEQLPILGNTTQLQQVMMNLLNNARDAVSHIEKPVIKVKMMSLQHAKPLRSAHPDLEGEWLYLSVQDNGCGIKTEDVDHIFEPFFTTKGAGKGTGLGLAMCYGALQSHGGLIEVESEPDKGCAFHIYLPLENGSEKHIKQNGVDKDMLGKGETILLVDDDEGLRVAHQSVLEKLNYKILHANDGLEAIKVYAEHGSTVDIVLMDTMMPNMGGFQAAKHILTMNKDVKLIFMSGYDMDSTTERWLKEDAKELETIKRLQKPFTINVLCKALREELG